MAGRRRRRVFNSVAPRIELALRLTLGMTLRPDQPVQFATIPAMVASLVNESVARLLRTTANRVALLWAIVLLAIIGGMVAVGR